MTSNDLHIVYEATIRSLLEYASPVLVGLSPTLSELLNRIVRRAHCIMAHNEDFKCECEDLKIRRQRLALKLFLEAESDSTHILHSRIPHRLKHSDQFSVPYCRTCKRQKSFIPCVSLLRSTKLK